MRWLLGALFALSMTAVALASGTYPFIGNPNPTASPTATPTLPPQGVYNSCDNNLSTCETEDAAIASNGFTQQIDYFACCALSVTNLNSRLTNMASLSPPQTLWINVKEMLGDTSIGSGCSGTCNNMQNVRGSIPGCSASTDYAALQCLQSLTATNYGFYAYDEPGCPNQTIGYCQGSLAGGAYQNVAALIALLHTMFPSATVLGINTPSGVPSGGWNSANGQTQISNLFSCNGQTACATPTAPPTAYPWMVAANQGTTGFDYYPYFCQPSGTCGAGQVPGDEQNISQYLGVVIAANNPGQSYAVGLQAFSGFQEGGSGCTVYADCTFPTTAQMQSMRDNAIFGYHPSYIFWYYWPDVTCINTYTGCNSATNQASLQSAAFAAYPSSP